MRLRVRCRHLARIFNTANIATNMMYTPEMSPAPGQWSCGRRSDSWGGSGIAELVDGLCDRAQQFAEQLAVNGFQIGNDVVFDKVLVACATPEQTKATLARIPASGECWCGQTTWQDKPAIRISVCSWATTPDVWAILIRSFCEGATRQMSSKPSIISI